jgi:hypothetical protein
MSATIKFNESTFTVKNLPEYRADPEKEFAHRLQTRDHLKYLQDENLFDVRDPRWAKKTIDGEVCYAHAYENGLLIVRLKTADGKLNLTHNEDGTLDRHLMDNPSENPVYSITSANNNLESYVFFKTSTIGFSSLGIVCFGLAMTYGLASGLAAAEAGEAAGVAVTALLGIDVNVLLPGVGIALAVLAFIGIWIAYEIAREIVVNLNYENRSATMPLTLVDSYVYDIPMPPDIPPLPVTLNHLHGIEGWELYDNVVINADNESKYKGVGVSLKFQKADGSSLIICIRQDIYHQPKYAIVPLNPGDTTGAWKIYDDLSYSVVAPLKTEDFPWGNLVVKNTLKPDAFNNYKFTGIFSFNDAS